MIRYLLALALFSAPIVHAQEGPTPTQTLVAFDSKTPVQASASSITFKVDGRDTPITSLVPVSPANAQIALLIDDGLRTSIGRELNTLRTFVSSLPQGSEVFVGYMQNGRVVPGGDSPSFTTDHAAAAQSLRISSGLPGASASPYFCLSDFVKNWPGDAEDQAASSVQRAPVRKARFVLMITNGVDPYNGSTSIMNQNSPYVDASVADAQRAGVPVYSIYFADAGRRRGSFSGQSYLSQIAEGTGGVAYYQGTGNPVSLAPFLQQFERSVAESYIATFPAEANKKLVRLKASTSLPKAKARTASLVRPGTVVLSQ